MGSTFDDLPDVAIARDLLRRWWGLELGLAEAGGGGYVRKSHAVCETIHGAAPAACAGALAEIAAELASSKSRDPVIRQCHAGLILVVAPVFGAHGLIGVVYATGARAAERPLAEVGEGLAAIVGSPAEASAMAGAVPVLGADDVGRVRDLVVSAAAAVERVQPAVVAPTTFSHPFTEIVGEAAAVRDVVKLLTKVVKSEATVLVHGESGTGKELIARAIHYHGPRAKKPFVVQNCSAFNDNLLESALFGHVRGAFTGAVKDQPGLFQVADGGTFFLDEIGDMSAALQVKLLRVLQEGTFMPVGGTKPVKVDVRIIAASHKDLATMVAVKQFREDLFYRVNVLKITVPPLRERVSDIPRLAQFFVAKHWRSAKGADATVPPRLAQGALARLVAYPWPGNIRELENEIERMLVLAGDAPELTGAMVSARVAGGAHTAPRALRDVIATAEADAIVAALGRHGGDRDSAAQDLGISRSYFDARSAALGLGASA
ncbi:MAG: sigma-54-dependent Fis family transcriptional regulator [Deltaproteobacteria bacterium]|nr:MAG: sigma-54-dependent Fis family transcriptional regulator [Deltaproteobacteria bacterium]TMQ27343.1 MAG: sigma-54-dependent Fis family transcriptional regulator [Deltaproteobacteria bacterium]